MDLSAKLIVDGLLVAGFGVQHSVLATLRVKRAVKARTKMEALAWRSVESLSNVVYILVAAALWQHTDTVIWHATGTLEYLLYAVTAVSWLWYWQLHLFEYDCGLAFGSTTLVSRVTGSPGPKLVPWKVGSRRWIRFPVHTAFFGMFLFLPTMTADLLVLGIVLNVYNVIGSILYDLRLFHLSGNTYKPYADVTGLIFPPVYRAPRGAAELTMPVPTHWRRPLSHIPGLVVGIGLGLGYYLLIDPNSTAPLNMLAVGGAGLLAAVVSGLLLGRLVKPMSEDWGQRQTDLSTTVALSAAVGVVTWAGVSWLATGEPPGFAAFLPLWFTVQYLGHVFAVLASPAKWGAPESLTTQGEFADQPTTSSANHAMS
jgi:methanethiol S-methyltransferase